MRRVVDDDKTNAVRLPVTPVVEPEVVPLSSLRWSRAIRCNCLAAASGRAARIYGRQTPLGLSIANERHAIRLRASHRNASYPQQPPHKAVDKSDFSKRIRGFIRWLFLDQLFLESFQRSLAARASPKQEISLRSAVVAKKSLTVHSGACALPVSPAGLMVSHVYRGSPGTVLRRAALVSLVSQYMRC